VAVLIGLIAGAAQIFANDKATPRIPMPAIA